MAYKARTLLGKPNEPNAYRGIAPGREVGGMLLTGRLKTYTGKPDQALLDDDLVDVQTLEGKPWPRSSCDRNSKVQHRMRIMQEDGRWPSKREQALQAFAEAKLKDPDGAARKVLKDQGYRPDEIEKVIARSRSTTKNIPTLDDPEPPKRGPGRPRKGAED